MEKNIEKLNATILIVDDNAINRLFAKKVLEKWGIVSDYASDGEEAVEKIINSSYDLVLMDIHMPKMDGYEVTQKVRRLPDEKYHKLPIIALTASIMIDDIALIKKSGMNDYIMKPFVPDELYLKIKSHLNKMV